MRPHYFWGGSPLPRPSAAATIARMISGLQVLVAARGEHDGGSYVVLDVKAAAGTRLPAHTATREELAVLVLRGELELQSGGGGAEARRILGAGAWAVLGRDRPRRITVVEDAWALCVAAPAGLESLVDAIADPVVEPDDLSALLAAAGVSLLPRGWRPVTR